MLLPLGLNLWNCEIRDTMLIAHLEDENALSKGLDALVQRFWKDNYKEVFWSKYKDYADAPAEEALIYACKDAYYTFHLYHVLMANLYVDGVPDSLVTHVHRLSKVLAETERDGIAVDYQYLIQLGVELKPKIEEHKRAARMLVQAQAEALEQSLWAKEINAAYTPTGKKWKSIPRPELNLSSSSQLMTLLYDLLRLPEQTRWDKATQQKRRTVDDDALERLEGRHPIITHLRELRTYEKVYGSFIEGTLERVVNDRIYPEFNVNGAVTGRISSSNPNMQQLPAKGEWARVRGIYVPDPGQRIITCDYGQLEVVIAAHFSGDANLLRIIHEGASKHDITAAALRIPRGLAKTVNFGMQYGCGPAKVAAILGCSKADGQLAWNKYWEAYAGEKRVVDECKAKVDAGEPIVNIMGRHRRFPVEFESVGQREACYRQAYSAKIQGSGAELTHWSLYTTDERLRQQGLGKALFEVHDEILITAHEKACEEAASVLASTMVEAGKVFNLTVPLTVDCSKPLERWEK